MQRATPQLWRFALHFVFVAFAAQRVVAAIVLHERQAGGALVAVIALQGIAGALAAISVLAGRFITASVAAVAVTVVAGALARVLG